MDICRETQNISGYIKNWILKQPEVKEESLTDWLLFQMSEKVANVVSITFTRKQEGMLTGADWEWWFLYPNNNYKIRVQAKKMNNNDNYPQITYSNKYGLQIKKLLQDAIETNSIPLYAFYSSMTENTMCNMDKNDGGIFLAGANEVYKAFITGGRRMIKPEDLIKIALVLSCFFCCPLICHENNFEKFIKKYYHLENTGNIVKTMKKGLKIDPDNSYLGMHKKLPNYVKNLIQNKDRELSYYEREFSRDITGINALLVCDFRDGINLKYG